MGNTITTKHEKQHKGILQDWQTIDHIDNYNLVRNVKTNQIGQARRYRLDSIYDPDDQFQIFQMRGKSDQPIVKAYFGELLDKVSRKMGKQADNKICASNNYLAVVTERIPYTLASLPQLTFPQTLLILQKSLQGFSHLYPRSGPTHITQKMIGINKEGQVKVWINEDFSKNHPNSQIRTLLSTRNNKLDRQYNLITPQFRDEKQMIENIIDVVQDKCQNGVFQAAFHGGVRENGDSFARCMGFVQEYIREKGIIIPKGIHEKYVYLEKGHNFQNNIVLARTRTQLSLQTSNKTNLNKIEDIPISQYSPEKPHRIPSNNLQHTSFTPNIQPHQPLNHTPILSNPPLLQPRQKSSTSLNPIRPPPYHHQNQLNSFSINPNTSMNMNRLETGNNGARGNNIKISFGK